MGSRDFSDAPATTPAEVVPISAAEEKTPTTPVEVAPTPTAEEKTPSIAELVRRAVITSGATLTPEDIDKATASILGIGYLQGVLLEEKVTQAGIEFQAATEEPSERLRAEIEKLYKAFNEEVAPANAKYNEALKAAGYPGLDDAIADSCPGCEVPEAGA